ARLRMRSSPSLGDGAVDSLQWKSVSLMIPWGRAARSHCRFFSSAIATPDEEGFCSPFSGLRAVRQVAYRNRSHRGGGCASSSSPTLNTREGRRLNYDVTLGMRCPVQELLDRGTNIESEAAPAIARASNASPPAKPPVVCFM